MSRDIAKREVKLKTGKKKRNSFLKIHRGTAISSNTPSSFKVNLGRGFSTGIPFSATSEDQW